MLHKLQSHGVSGQISGLISSFLNKRRLRLVVNGKILQEYPDNAGVPQTALIMLSVILLSMLVILLFILSVIRHLICGNN